MVDIKRRKKLAYHLKQFFEGITTNDEFEEGIIEDVTDGWLPEQYYRSKKAKNDDPALRPILEYCWCLYSDTKNHHLQDERELTALEKEEIERVILFLKSEQVYKWEYVDLTHLLTRFTIKDIIKSILTFGNHYKTLKRKREEEFEKMKEKGNYEYWPFLMQQDFNLEKNKKENGK